MSGTALTVTGKWNFAKKCVEVHPVFWDDVKVPDGSDVTAVLSLDRNPAQLRFYWAVAGEIVKAGYWDSDKDGLDDWTRMAVGFGKWRPIAAETAVLEVAYNSAWQIFLVRTGMERLAKAFRAAIEAYVAATPPREVFIPDSISMARCDGIKFNEYLRSAEKVWAERLHVDIEAIRREAPPLEPVKHSEQINGSVNPEQAVDANNVIREPIGARLRALASRLRKSSPEAFAQAWAAEKTLDEAIELYRAVPAQLEAVKKLCAQKASGLFSDSEFEEVLKRIVTAAEEVPRG